MSANEQAIIAMATILNDVPAADMGDTFVNFVGAVLASSGDPTKNTRGLIKTLSSTLPKPKRAA